MFFYRTLRGTRSIMHLLRQRSRAISIGSIPRPLDIAGVRLCDVDNILLILETNTLLFRLKGGTKFFRIFLLFSKIGIRKRGTTKRKIYSEEESTRGEKRIREMEKGTHSSNRLNEKWKILAQRRRRN